MKDYKFKISIIIPVYNAEEYLVETIESVIVQSLDFKKNIQLILVNDGSTDGSEEICKEYQKLYPENIKYIKKRNGGVSSTRNLGLSYVEGKYLNFLDSDDKWGMNVCETVYKFFEEHYDEIDVIGVRIKYFEARNSWHALDHKFHNGNRVADLTTEEECSTIQLSAATTFIKTDAITEEDRFDETIRYGEDSLFINRIILRKLKLGVLCDVLYYYRFRNNQSSAIQTQKFDPAYYDYAARRYYDGIINASKELYGEVVPYIQQVLAYDIGWRVGMPLPEEICNDEAFYNKYMDFLRDRLQYVDESIILKNKVHKNITKKEALINVKNGGGFYENTSYMKEEEAICYKDTPIIHLSGKHGCCHVNFCELFKNEDGKDYLRIEGYVAKWLFNCCQDEKKELILRIGRKRIAVGLKEYPFLPERNIFGERQRYYYFQEELPFEPKLDKENTVKIRLALQIGDDIANLSLKYGKFIADTRIFKAAYQIYGKYVFTFNRKRIVVRKPDDIAKEHRKLEFRSISWLIRNKLGKYARIRARVAWLKKTKYAGKRLWIITDRFEKAGDNGEAFFRYLNSGEVDLGNIEPVFAISRDSVDVKRLKSIGKVIYLEDKDYVVKFLCADAVISASGSDFAFNPLDRQQRFYLTDLIKPKLVFLQHGIIYNDLSAWLTRYNKKIDYFVTSAKPEYDSITGGNYLYTDKEVILTGLPRYDLLENKAEKKVLILPTWRKSIKESYGNMNQSIYFDGFKETEYFQFYNNLINDERLLKVMREKGYRGEFCLHPVHEKQSVDYETNDVFEANSGFVDYKKVFSESSLLITDYSSIFFDFAYLRKPVIYSQFDKEEFFEGQVFDTGYFDYATDAFGPVCYDYESTVQAIINAIENDCVNPPEYLERIEKFYAYNDRNNCKRIFDIIK